MADTFIIYSSCSSTTIAQDERRIDYYYNLKGWYYGYPTTLVDLLAATRRR